jgi:tripartite-type tricarboxylate transporter receptor subunit TctC
VLTLEEAMKRAFAAAFAALVAATPLTLPAQARFPTKPVTIVVPYPPGGSNDTFARAIGKKLTEAWGHPVIIENKPGAGGNIGAAYVSKAAPDGYTLVLMSSSYTTGAAVTSNLPFDPVKGLTPITMVARGPMILAVSNSLPVKDVEGLIRLAKSQPGKLNFGSSGAGSTNQFATELWMAAAGVQMTHVPYKGMAPAVTDLVGGHVDVLFASLPSVYAHTEGRQGASARCHVAHAVLRRAGAARARAERSARLPVRQLVGRVGPAGACRRRSSPRSTPTCRRSSSPPT